MTSEKILYDGCNNYVYIKVVRLYHDTGYGSDIENQYNYISDDEYDYDGTPPDLNLCQHNVQIVDIFDVIIGSQNHQQVNLCN